MFKSKIARCNSTVKIFRTTALNNDQLGRIRHIVHDLNRAYYKCLVEVKSSKLKNFRQQQHQQAPSHVRNADSHKLVVTIPEDLPLSEDERSVLSNGLTYIPRKNNIAEFQAKSDVEQFYCRLRLKAHFFDQKKKDSGEDEPSDEPSIPPPLRYSSWTPLQGKFTALDLYIDKCRHDIAQLDFKTTLSQA